MPEFAQSCGFGRDWHDFKPFHLIHDLMEMNIIATIDRAIYPAGTTLNCKEHEFIFEVSPSEGDLD